MTRLILHQRERYSALRNSSQWATLDTHGRNTWRNLNHVEECYLFSKQVFCTQGSSQLEDSLRYLHDIDIFTGGTEAGRSHSWGTRTEKSWQSHAPTCKLYQPVQPSPHQHNSASSNTGHFLPPLPKAGWKLILTLICSWSGKTQSFGTVLNYF